MKTTGIIAEFNPFTNGHQYFIDTLRKQGSKNIIAVMSGSFVQRGEPAFANKFLRAKTAVQCGVDLVFELPTPWVLRSAEHFARGGIALLKATGIVDTIACGTEHPDFNFKNCANEIKNKQAEIKATIQTGKSYAQALSANIANLPKDPNDILALEYTKQAGRLKMLYIQRQGNYHNNTLNKFASASAVRADWDNARKFIPKFVYETLKNKTGYDKNLFWKLIQYRLITLTPTEIFNVTTANEGLENVLKKTQNASSLENAFQLCSTKRYPLSHISRLFAQLVLCQNRKIWQQKQPKYLRVLAFNDNGRKLLKAMKNTATLPIITKAKNLYPADVIATDLLALLQGQNTGIDFTVSPIYVQ
ncbi:MAG: nucleotidyltransferase family protein [Phascolarctobacterium sp.]|nr:nucleotidyltransferase family protein [Candidatus Phascolarctobacterium caballi]